jgi:hypothetical protein
MCAHNHALWAVTQVARQKYPNHSVFYFNKGL